MDGIGRYAGIDWAQDRHAVCVVDERGMAVSRFEVEHTAIGLRELTRRLEEVAGVAIERPDGPIVEALLGADIPIVVIASRQAKALRIRHGLADNKDDRMQSDTFTWQTFEDMVVDLRHAMGYGRGEEDRKRRPGFEERYNQWSM